MYQVFEALGSGLVCLLWAILGDFPVAFYMLILINKFMVSMQNINPSTFKCLMNIIFSIHQLNLTHYYPPSCIKAVDKNLVKIQICVLETDACHNLKLVRFCVVFWITTKGNKHLISISRTKIEKLTLF